MIDQQLHAVTTDRIETAARLGAPQQRRALMLIITKVLIITNSRGKDTEVLLAGVRCQLQRRYFACVAGPHESILDTLMNSAPESIDTALEASTAARYVEQHQRAHHAQLTSLLDAKATQRPGAPMDHYLAMTRAGRL